MRRKRQPETANVELATAIGLVWGHLRAGQPDLAHQLAQGCLGLWPGERNLALMAAFAAAEMLEPVDLAPLRSLAGGDDLRAWIALVERRAVVASDAAGDAP